MIGGPTPPSPEPGRRRAPIPHPLSALPVSAPSTTPVHHAPVADDSGDLHDQYTARFPLLPTGLTQLLFTAEQAAVLLAVRASWLRRAAAEGAIASTYLGKHLRFSHADLLAIIATGARGYRPTTPHPRRDPRPGART